MQSYDSAPRPLPSPLSRQQVDSLSQFSCVSPVELTDGGVGEGVGEEPNHTTAKKLGPRYSKYSISILSDVTYRTKILFYDSCREYA